ncbi:uncharacterized protein AC631_01885 [Debaryomyces fabryi]|uniref:Mitochondrial ATPase complex subunit ATP10 n=1 Tax=Debaryomyces fabryi TaxID=58627 RepID=A0A0V1Q1I0_9ASCO|nr:uncharacterized protein AC631_01885 [Debaryomyces fabryi]KSA02327.1 hypothetical protein AC631_01885 [Debaryomyces fabryi]CUM51494.1 unnamed protein product [Debaryomyces fabryi]
MIKVQTRAFAQVSRLLDIKTPRFTQTLKETSKPALTKSHLITRPFGLDSAIMINQAGHGMTGLVSNKMFGSDAKERRQKQLDYEITHSPFYESKSFTNTNGKIFTPPVSFFKREKSKYFPNFVGTTVEGKDQSLFGLLEGKVSIVRLYSTVSGERCSETYFNVEGQNYLTSGYSAFETEHPMSQIIDINIPQNLLKGLLVRLSRGSIKRSIPKQRHNKYFVVSDKLFLFDIRQKIMCDNMCSGYIYVLDHQGHIRWATSGYADEAELKLMWKCVRGLEKELKSLSI